MKRTGNVKNSYIYKDRFKRVGRVADALDLRSGGHRPTGDSLGRDANSQVSWATKLFIHALANKNICEVIHVDVSTFQNLG